VDTNAEAGKPSPLLAYNNGQSVTSDTASGVSLNLLYDSRDNPINATKGYYASLSFRAFPKWLGSDSNWQSLLADFRAYPHPGGGRNILAVWAYAWLTFGKAPYLDLPATGWDTYGRSGRGYVQGQIRGKNQLYTEGEYRISLSPDGLWGAVVFLNVIATTEPNSGRFGLNTGVGLGLRVKLNKGSNTNICIDYGFGQQDTSGLYLNAQEAF
jgi:outer membrane translocation and assembly module TamA